MAPARATPGAEARAGVTGHDVGVTAAVTSLPRLVTAPALDLGRGVRFDPPIVLAPMEGVTHRVFRDLILDLGGPGAAWTEFLRVSTHALKPSAIARELGPQRPDVPVGVQLMGTDPDLIAETARNAVLAGAPMVDLNFGCPAPIVFNKCAGSALLAHPDKVEALVRAAAQAVDVPVTAKVRLGVEDWSRFEDVVRAVEAAGAAAITVHARTRKDGYSHPARWEHLPRVRAWTKLPVIGNGDVVHLEDAERMLATCGVDGVMIGRGALRDPWIFARLRAARLRQSPPLIGPADVLAFHRRYRDEMRPKGSMLGTLGQLKQIWRRLGVGVPIDDATRTALLRTQSIDELDAMVDALASR